MSGAVRAMKHRKTHPDRIEYSGSIGAHAKRTDDSRDAPCSLRSTICSRVEKDAMGMYSGLLHRFRSARQRYAKSKVLLGRVTPSTDATEMIPTGAASGDVRAASSR